MQLIIDSVPYEVTKTKDNLTGIWFSVDNFVGMDGIIHLVLHNPFGESGGLALGCQVEVDEDSISVNCDNFDTFEDVCRFILRTYKSIGWELLDLLPKY